METTPTPQTPTYWADDHDLLLQHLQENHISRAVTSSLGPSGNQHKCQDCTGTPSSCTVLPASSGASQGPWPQPIWCNFIAPTCTIRLWGTLLTGSEQDLPLPCSLCEVHPPAENAPEVQCPAMPLTDAALHPSLPPPCCPYLV